MTTPQDDTNPTIAVRDDEALDFQALDACLKDRIPGLTGTATVSQFPSGNSNLTYRLLYPTHDLVVRRPPFGTRPKSGHSMIREYRVMAALKPVFPEVPVVHFHSDDEAIIGAEFYVMDRVPGHLIKATIPAAWNFDEGRTRTLCENFWDRLIALHGIDYEAIGLGDFGKPQGYVERQVLGWNRRYENARTDDVEDFADVRAWLEAERPTQENAAALLHGDYRIDNVILDAGDPTRIVAVLDWEICALGDPLMDLGNSLAYWLEAGDPDSLKSLRMQPSDAPGMMTRQEILRRYGEATGLDTDRFGFYLAYGTFRLAVILQQIYYRYVQGQTRDERFAGFGHAVNALGAYARAIIEHEP